MLAGLGCCTFYLLYLPLELVCEIDASRRGVRELLRHGFLQKSEFRVTRRILRAALGTYLAAFGGTGLALTFFLPQVNWGDLHGQHPQLPLAAPLDGQSSAAEQAFPSKAVGHPVPVHFRFRGFQRPTAGCRYSPAMKSLEQPDDPIGRTDTSDSKAEAAVTAFRQ